MKSNKMECAEQRLEKSTDNTLPPLVICALKEGIHNLCWHVGREKQCHGFSPREKDSQ